MNSLYVPILRAKQGEFEALGHLSPKSRAITRPMLDLPFKESDTPLQMQFRIADVTRRVAETWGTSNSFYFDLSRYPATSIVDSGENVLEFLFLCARQHRLRAIPTTVPARDRGLNSSYFDLLARIVELDGRGVAVRMTYDTFAERDYLRQNIDELLASLRVANNQIDLILDAGSLAVLPRDYSNPQSLLAVLSDALAVAKVYGLRSIVFAGSSFPEKFKKTVDEAPITVPRSEVSVWRNLILDDGISSLVFGDYGVVFPRETDPEGIVIVPSRIRLTTPTGFLLFKGAPDQYGTLCREAVKHDDFGRIMKCWGLNEIQDTAIGRSGDSGATVWVARDTNIHIETMANTKERELVATGKLQATESVSSYPWLQDRLWPSL